MTVIMRVALFLAAFSLVLIGGTYSHGPEIQHTHISESTNTADHAHMETAIDIDMSNDVLHCGTDISQFAQFSTVNFVRTSTQILSLKSQTGKNLWFALDPPPPRLYS